MGEGAPKSLTSSRARTITPDPASRLTAPSTTDRRSGTARDCARQERRHRGLTCPFHQGGVRPERLRDMLLCHS